MSKLLSNYGPDTIALLMESEISDAHIRAIQSQALNASILSGMMLFKAVRDDLPYIHRDMIGVMVGESGRDKIMIVLDPNGHPLPVTSHTTNWVKAEGRFRTWNSLEAQRRPSVVPSEEPEQDTESQAGPEAEGYPDAIVDDILSLFIESGLDAQKADKVGAVGSIIIFSIKNAGENRGIYDPESGDWKIHEGAAEWDDSTVIGEGNGLRELFRFVEDMAK